MARRRGRRPAYSYQRRGVAVDIYDDPFGQAWSSARAIETPLSSYLLDRFSGLHQRRQSFLSEVQDRRRFDPDRHAVARTVSGARHRLRAVPGRAGPVMVTLGNRIAFHAPEKMIVCRRRAMRREVMFATKRAGQGARQQVRKRNWMSDIDC